MALAVLAILLIACGGGQAAGPAETATSLPRQATPLPPASVTSSMQASCRLLSDGAEIRVDYRASARDGVLTRVRLVKDGVVVDDSGNIEAAQWNKLHFYVVNGGVHIFQVQVEAGSMRQNSGRSVVRCPALPSPNRV